MVCASWLVHLDFSTTSMKMILRYSLRSWSIHLFLCHPASQSVSLHEIIITFLKNQVRSAPQALFIWILFKYHIHSLNTFCHFHLKTCIRTCIDELKMYYTSSLYLSFTIINTHFFGLPTNWLAPLQSILNSTNYYWFYCSLIAGETGLAVLTIVAVVPHFCWASQVS